jgi:hypothetical protein
LVEAEQDSSICVLNLTKVIMAWRRVGLPQKRLIPLKAAGNVTDADNRPYAFHETSAIALVRMRATPKAFGVGFIAWLGIWTALKHDIDWVAKPQRRP